MKKKRIQKTGKKVRQKRPSLWENQKLLSITAVLISIGTLLVFLYQTNLVRKQQYMSVFPYLEFENHALYSKEYKLVLKNKGIGPALIISRSVVINDKEYDLDLGMYLEERITLEDTMDLLVSNISQGNLISEKESVELVAIQPNTSNSGMEKLHGLIYNDSVEFVVQYESVYGERWKVSSRDLTPRKLD